MDPQTVLRFVKSIGAWPGRVIVIACEPADVEEVGWGLSDQVKEAVERAVELVVETIDELRAQPAHAARGVSRARAVAEQRDRRHRRQARGRPARHASSPCASGACARSSRETLEFYFEFVARGTRLRGRAARAGAAGSPAALQSVRRPSGRSTSRRFAARAVAAATSRSSAATSSRSNPSRSRRPNASHQGDGRRGGARRQQHDRQRQPGGLRPRRRQGDQLHERPRRRQDDAARAGRGEPARRARRACSRATCRDRWTPTASPACTCR